MTPDGGVLPGDRYCMFALLPCTRPPSNRVTRTNLGSRQELAQPVVVQSESAVESLPSTRLPATHAVAVTRRGGPGGRVAVRDAAVRRIAAQAEFTPKFVQTQEERTRTVFAVEIALSNQEGILKPGMPADAVIGAAATNTAPAQRR